MSDSVGFGFGEGATAAQDDSIALDLGLDTTGGLAGQIVPEGTHRFRIGSVDVNYTNAGELMLGLPCTVIATNIEGAMGLLHNENLIIPGAERKANDEGKWKVMMKMLRMKLEAITGRPWREDSVSLSPNRDLVNREFIATVYHEDSVVEDEDGNEKRYQNARLRQWEAVTDQQQFNVGSTVGAPQVATPTTAPAAPTPWDPSKEPF